MKHFMIKLRERYALTARTTPPSRAAKRRPATRDRRFESLETRQVLSAAPLSAAELESSVVYEAPAAIGFDAAEKDIATVAHSESLELDSGGVVTTFVADNVDGRQTLFSKDHNDFQEGGHLTAWIVDGRIEVRLQSDSQSIKLRSAIDSVRAGETHTLGVSFGERGARLYLDGLIADAEVDFSQGIATNDNPIVLGASAIHRNGENANLRDYFDGTIETFAIYDAELGLVESATLAGLDLARPISVEVVDGFATGTDANEYMKRSQADGGYGDDLVDGDDQANVLSGGHGEDVLFGRGGDDLLISRSDGREPIIAQDYDNGDDPNGEIDPESRTLYPNQPIAADDMLFGGAGADTFRFEILVNAKERILFKHVNDDGTIDWKGVTGENGQVHDHWVDRIGDEVVADFNRDEGDKIEFVGHTVDVYKVEHVDSDGDGALDSSVMYVQSNQGAAGAHNKDQLGTVTVYGDLVRRDDYTVHAHANLGIVETIGELGEALAPVIGDTVAPDGVSRWRSQSIQEEPLPHAATFAVGEPLAFNGKKDDYVEIAHSPRLELESGTFAVEFSVDDAEGRQTLFSKDHSGFEQGGHLTAWVADDRVQVRLQSAEESVWIQSERGAVTPGVSHHMAVTFGDGGVRLFVDGELVDAKISFTQGITENEFSLILGASSAGREGDRLNARDPLSGEVQSFTVYDRALTRGEIALVAGDRSGPEEPTAGGTGTGLDALVDVIVSDRGLRDRISEEEINAGAQAADAMNALVIEAIRATGIANDGRLTPSDLRDLNTYLREEHLEEWTRLHGDDEEGVETGFHLVQNDGARTHWFGDSNAVNTVADGVYHLAFEIDGWRLTNEDGAGNASLADVAYWLNELLAEDLRSGALANAEIDLTAEGATGTGLDNLVTMIGHDRGLASRIATSEIVEGAQAADAMNQLIVSSIVATGVANDGEIDKWDIYDINHHLRDNHLEEWTLLHGDDEQGVETGFHLVQNDGAQTHLFGDENAVNTVADGLYHLGFEIEGSRLLNEDGDKNASLEDVAFWLDELLADDLAEGRLTNEELLPDEAFANF